MKTNRIFLITLFTLFLVFNCVSAKAFSLKDAISLAILNNEKLQMSKKNLEIAILEKPRAVTEFLPSINVNWNKTFFNPSYPTQYENKSSFSKESFRIYIEQDIFTGGSTIAKIAIADAKINSAYHEYNKSLNEIILRVIQSYQNVLTYREFVQIQKINVDMAQKSVEKATITVKTGAETKTALFLARANLASMKSNLENYLVKQDQAETSFQYIVGEKAPKIIEQIDIKKYIKIKDFDQFKALVNIQNPDLIKVKGNFEVAKQQINIAASRIMPTVNLFADASKSKYSDNVPYNMQNDYKGNTYGIRVSIPLLYKGGIQYLDISDAKKKKKSAELEVRNVIRGIKAQTISTWNQYISSQSIYKSACVSEDNYYQTYISAQAEFDVGARTIMDIIEVQEKYNVSALDRLNKEASYKLSFFEIYNLIGNLPKIVQNSEEVIQK